MNHTTRARRLPIDLSVWGACVVSLGAGGFAVAQTAPGEGVKQPPQKTDASALTIAIDPARQFQRIEGFGTCLFPWGEDNRRAYNTPGFDKIYAEELGLNIVRINLEHFLCKEFEKPEDITREGILINDMCRVYTDMCKKVKALNPDVRILATVWSPPAWMKVNNKMDSGAPRGQNAAILASSYTLTKNRGVCDNRVREDRYPHFVAWMTAVADWFKHEGIPLYAMSPANEPRFSQYYGSCVWTAKDFATIIALLGEGLEKAGHGDILLYGPEDMTGHLHNEGTSRYVQALMEDPRASKQLDRFATHGYTDGVQADVSQDSSHQFWTLIEKYNKPYWMTEGGTGEHAWPKPVTEGAGIAIHNSLVAGNASAFVPWQITGGKATGHNFMLMDKMTPKTRTLLHFARAVPTDGRRISAEPAFGPVLASAYHRAQDGRLGIVLINPTKQDCEVTLSLGKFARVENLRLYRTTNGESVDDAGETPVRAGEAKVAMPAESIASLRGVATLQ